MLKNIIVFGLIALGVYYFGFRQTDLDRVMKPAAQLSAGADANIFVQPDYKKIPIDDQDYAVEGVFTVVFYHMETCPGCRRLDGDLVHMLALRKDIAIRKIDLGTNWSTETAIRDYGRNIGATPFIIIYGPKRTEIRADEGRNNSAFKLLYEWMNEEFKKEYYQKQGKPS